MACYPWIPLAVRRTIAGAMSVCLIVTGFPAHGPRSAGAQTNTRVQSATSADDAAPAADHFLRDAIPVTLAAATPPDSTDDDFVLPEEKGKKQLVKEIALFVVVAAFVAYFIVKVFIEEDNSSTESGSNGKPVNPPR